MSNATTYPHYFKPTPYPAIDVYRVLSMWNVTHPAIQHAAKKVLCAGARGSKAWRKDIEEARDSLQRALDMDAEDEAALRMSDDGKGAAMRMCGWLDEQVRRAMANAVTDAMPVVKTAHSSATRKEVMAKNAAMLERERREDELAAERLEKALREPCSRARDSMNALLGGQCWSPEEMRDILNSAKPAAVASKPQPATKHAPRYFGGVDVDEAPPFSLLFSEDGLAALRTSGIEREKRSHSFWSRFL